MLLGLLYSERGGVGRGCGVGRSLGVTLGVAVGVGVAVGFAVGVRVGVSLGVGLLQKNCIIAFLNFQRFSASPRYGSGK